jgi:ABC-type multidrug transport system ATPase subunit
MSDKIQMTEEQAREFCDDIGFSDKGTVIYLMKKRGYIRKSELQQKVEEAKRMWDTKTYWTPLEHIQREAIELLEQSHPEFKK